MGTNDSTVRSVTDVLSWKLVREEICGTATSAVSEDEVHKVDQEVLSTDSFHSLIAHPSSWMTTAQLKETPVWSDISKNPEDSPVNLLMYWSPTRDRLLWRFIFPSTPSGQPSPSDSKGE